MGSKQKLFKMAKNLNNVLLQGMTGKIGDLVFTRDGRVRSRPDVSKRKWSPCQCAHLSRVQEGKVWARHALSDPALRPWYASLASKKPGLGAWHIAISDYYNRPEIVRLTLHDNRPAHPVLVKILATDKFMVREVRVTVSGPGGKVVEVAAASHETPFDEWTCPLKSDLFRKPGLILTVEATDTPGNRVFSSFGGPFCPGEPLVELR
jgi:hypothetical protein